MSHVHFADLLTQRIHDTGAPACVGLDPVFEQLPASLASHHHEPLGAIAEFGRGVIRAAAPHAAAIKFQSACYERYGGRGLLVLEEHMVLASQAGLAIVLDAKRGDIGLSAAHYAAAAKRLFAHAITVSGYLGPSGVTPFLDAGLGVFVLVRTSNPDSDRVQAPALADGRSVAEAMADLVSELGATRLGKCGMSDVGAVVGATKASDGAALRARMPRQVFLVPGYGAQGGTAEDVRALLTPDRRGVLVTASRSVIYAKPGSAETWEGAISTAAARLRDELAAIAR